MTERIRLACGCEIIRHEGIAATERVYCAQHGEAEAKSLTDERLCEVKWNGNDQPIRHLAEDMTNSEGE